MARPRAFDESEVLDQALRAFWSHGFDGTSIQDLVEATGLGRASLYGAFGDKQQLFDRALTHYLSRMGAGMRPLPSEKTLRATLERLLQGFVESACPQAGPRGCFLLQSAAAAEDESSYSRQALAAVRARMEQELTELLRAAQARGELNPRRDPAAAARLLVVLQQGIASGARAGLGAADLRLAAAEALEQLFGGDQTALSEPPAASGSSSTNSAP